MTIDSSSENLRVTALNILTLRKRRDIIKFVFQEANFGSNKEEKSKGDIKRKIELKSYCNNPVEKNSRLY